MKELSIVYQNADYTVRYECETQGSRHRSLINGRPALLNYTNYKVFFDDARLKEQFGDPFEFSTTTYPPDSPILIGKDSAAWTMADAIIRALPK